MSEANDRIDTLVKSNDVVLFMKGSALFPQCGFSSRAVAILDHLGVKFDTVDVLADQDASASISPVLIPQLTILLKTENFLMRKIRM